MPTLNKPYCYEHGFHKSEEILKMGRINSCHWNDAIAQSLEYRAFVLKCSDMHLYPFYYWKLVISKSQLFESIHARSGPGSKHQIHIVKALVLEHH